MNEHISRKLCTIAEFSLAYKKWAHHYTRTDSHVILHLTHECVKLRMFMHLWKTHVSNESTEYT